MTTGLPEQIDGGHPNKEFPPMSLIYVTTPRSDLLRRAAKLQREAAYQAVKAMNASASPHLVAARVHHNVRFVELETEVKAIRREAKAHARPNRKAAKTRGWFSIIYQGARIVIATADMRQCPGGPEGTLLVFIEGELDMSEVGPAMQTLIDAINRAGDTSDWLGAEDLTIRGMTAVADPSGDGYTVRLAVEGEEVIPWSDETPGGWEWASSRGVPGR
jgi:hypothetical protein